MHPIDILHSRRSIRKFKDKLVPFDNIIAMSEAVRNTPMAGNIFNVKLIFVREPSKRKAIAKACYDQAWISTAPVVFVITGEPEHQKRYYGSRGEKLYTIQNAAAAAMSLIDTATLLGLGSCWVSAFDEDELKMILGMGEEVNVHVIIPVGFADEKPKCPNKPELQTIAYKDVWWAHRKHPSYGFYSETWQQAASDAGGAIKKLGKKLLGKDEKKPKEEKQEPNEKIPTPVKEHSDHKGRYITSESAKRFHVSECPFAKNIPEESRIYGIRSQLEKINKLPCSCTKLVDHNQNNMKE